MSNKSELSSVSFNSTNFFGEQGHAAKCIQRVPIPVKLVMLILICSLGLFAFGLWLIIISALEVRNSTNTANVLGFAKHVIDLNRNIIKEGLYGVHNQLSSKEDYTQETNMYRNLVNEKVLVFLDSAKQFDMSKVNGWKTVNLHLTKLNEYRSVADNNLGSASIGQHLTEAYLELAKSLLTVELSMYFSDPESNSEIQVLLLLSRIVHEVTEEAMQGAKHLVLRQHNMTTLPLEAISRTIIQSADHRDSLFDLVQAMTPEFREVLRSNTEKQLALVTSIEALFYNHTYGTTYFKIPIPNSDINPETWMAAFLPCIDAHLSARDIQFNVVDTQVKTRQLNASLNIGIVIAMFILCVMVMAVFSFFFSQSIVATWRHLVKIQNEMVSKFVPKDFLRLINCNSILDIELGRSKCVDLTILACDIQNFASASSVLSPQETFNFVNAVLNHVGPIVRMFNGYIDKYLGHGFVAVFKDAKKALKASIELAHAAGAFNSMHSEYPAIKLVSGLHTSPCMIGTVGESMRMESAILSTSVTIANQLRSLNSKYHTNSLVTKEVLQRCMPSKKNADKPIDTILATPAPELRNIGKISWRKMGTFSVRNVNDSFEFFELLEEMDSKVKTKDVFDQAMKHFVDHNYASAIVDLKQVIFADPSDATASKLLQVCNVTAEDEDNGSSLVLVTDVLSRKPMRDTFEKYLIQEYSIENLKAYQLIEKFLTCSFNEKRCLIEELYYNFLDISAKYMLNINEATVRPIRAVVRDNIVMPLQKEVSFLMMDAFKRYRCTDVFKKSFKSFKMMQQSENTSVVIEQQ